jgi:hypothetical protein
MNRMHLRVGLMAVESRARRRLVGCIERGNATA